jgi:hypothetical protein
MTGKVIQASFINGRARVPAPAPFKTVPRIPRPPLPAVAGRLPVAQPRMPQPAAALVAGRASQAQPHTPGHAPQFDAGRLGMASGGGRPLPDAVRAKMESALRADFTHVRVHVGPQAARAGAIAFTSGTDIYFAPGRYQPDTVQGQQLLGHELAHVIQQRQGRVHHPTGSGIALVQDHALEAEADLMGHRAAAHRIAVQPKLAPGAAKPGRVSARGRSIQAMLSFSTEGHSWRPDSSVCTLCMSSVSSGHRHHCRVCGQFVCDDCSGQKFPVANPQTSSGVGSGTSSERVCVQCVLDKKISTARARSPKFHELITLAGNPQVRWERGCWPYTEICGKQMRIRLNPTRGDVFATFVFELTNAVEMRDRQSATTKSTTEMDPAQRAYGIEYQEYLGGIWCDEVMTEINMSSCGFTVQRVYAGMKPKPKVFVSHLSENLEHGHTELYFKQKKLSDEQLKNVHASYSQALERAHTNMTWEPAWQSRHDTTTLTAFPRPDGD